MTLRSKTFLKNSFFLIQPAICQNIRSNYINSNLELCLLPQPLCSVVSFENSLNLAILSVAMETVQEPHLSLVDLNSRNLARDY